MTQALPIRGRRLVAAGLFCSLLLVACAGQPVSRDELRVSAAASLADAFGQIEAAFESRQPGLDVQLNLAGSSALREQILGGAPVDVFASANKANMEQLAAAGALAGEPRVFAHNRLRIAVPAGNPAGVTDLTDFARPELLLGLCAAPVPCGDFARQALAKAGVQPSVDTEEPDVRALLTKIEAGELDAGITYVTDLTAGEGRAEGIEIPPSHNVAAEYPIAVLAGASDSDLAAAFVDFVTGPEGIAILESWGFERP